MKIDISRTEQGTRLHVNDLEKPFLKKYVDLNLNFDVFGRPLEDFVVLPKTRVGSPYLDFDYNEKTATKLAAELDDYRLSPSSIALQNSSVLLYVYVLVENSSKRFLFVHRIVTKLTVKTRKE